MVRRLIPHDTSAWAGLAAGPGAWLVSTQLNYALTPWVCAHKVNLILWASLLLAAAALVGAFVSWRVWYRYDRAVTASETGAAVLEAPRPFLAALSALLGILFALVIVTQGAATLFLDGCER